MKSLAKNRSDMEVPEKAPWYPSITVKQNALPGLKSAKVDDTGTMLVEYKVMGVSKYGNGDIEVSLDLIKGELTKDKDDGKKG